MTPIKGDVINQWTFLENLGVIDGRTRWLCQCRCGNIKEILRTSVTNKRSQSCGCLQRESVTKTGKANLTHGMRGNYEEKPEYYIWKSMIQRCRNPKRKDFRRYGGRGITVCKEWQDSFEAFFAHIGPRPSVKHQIDRIDNDSGYQPGNVHWVTASVQASNRTSNRLITLDGVTQTMSQWAKSSGLTVNAIHARLKNNWSIEDTIKTPLRIRKSSKTNA